MKIIKDLGDNKFTFKQPYLTIFVIIGIIWYINSIATMKFWWAYLLGWFTKEICVWIYFKCKWMQKIGNTIKRKIQPLLDKMPIRF